jgi:threonine aldolase
MPTRYDFQSDNTAGLCPEAWEALAQANQGHSATYGEDEYTARAVARLREIFETDCDVFFVFNGTAANALALAALCGPYHGVIAHAAAHAVVDECGAPQFFTGGATLVPLAGANGKLDPASIEAAIVARDDVHHPKPGAVTLTLPTEFGTLYTKDEIAAVGEIARRHGLKLHVDGARFANAVAAGHASAAELTWKAGVTALSLGGTKLGMGLGEAVVFFDRTSARDFAWRRKQGGQLASKSRLLAAPWVAMLESGAWLRHATHANACARRLGTELATIDGVTVNFPVEASAVFLDLPRAVREALFARGWHFHEFDGGGWRLMCSWATRNEDIDALVADIRAAAG